MLYYEITMIALKGIYAKCCHSKSSWPKETYNQILEVWQYILLK